MKGLTKKQRLILDFIERFSVQYGMSPTNYEIAEHFKIKASTVFVHLKALAKKKILSRSSKARSIVISDLYSGFRKNPKAKVLAIPLFESLVPFPAAEKKTEEFRGQYIAIDGNLFPVEKGHGLFALKIKDNQMSPIGVVTGDVAIFKTGIIAAQNDTVAVLARGETLVRVYLPNFADKIAELAEFGTSPKSRTYQLSEILVCGILAGAVKNFTKTV
jgi:repressor LexA